MFYINQFEALHRELDFPIEKSKNNCYSKLSQKLSNKTTTSKAYWSILKTSLNDKKILCIPPIFHDNKFGFDFGEKAELFNTFFTEQCSLSKKNSELPKNLLLLNKKRLSDVQISNENIIKIINNLDPNKAHGHDMISIRILKLRGRSLCKPLSIILKSCLSQMNFLWNRKMQMWFQSTKKMIKVHQKLPTCPFASDLQ